MKGSIHIQNEHGKEKRTTLLDILKLSSLDVNDLAKGLLCVVGDADSGNAVLDLDPLVLSSVLLGYQGRGYYQWMEKWVDVVSKNAGGKG